MRTIIISLTLFSQSIHHSAHVYIIVFPQILSQRRRWSYFGKSWSVFSEPLPPDAISSLLVMHENGRELLHVFRDVTRSVSCPGMSRYALTRFFTPLTRLPLTFSPMSNHLPRMVSLAPLWTSNFCRIRLQQTWGQPILPQSIKVWSWRSRHQKLACSMPV